MYHASFIPGKNNEKLKQYKPEGELKIGGNFNGESSYGAEFANRGVGERAEKIPLPKNHVMPEGKFDGNSNYQNQFVRN